MGYCVKAYPRLRMVTRNFYEAGLEAVEWN
jgi:hypothetical protein